VRRRTPPRGFTLVELFMAMTLAIIVVLATYFVQERLSSAAVVQSEVLEMNREARFALDHLRRDMMTVGSNVTPNSDVDANVCPKPAVALHALEASQSNDAVYAPTFNVNINPVTIKLFGPYDSSLVYRTISITGATVALQATNLPPTQAEWDALFNVNHTLRIVNRDGVDLYYPISTSDFGAKTVSLASAPPLVDDSQRCGIHGFGQNLEVFLVNFIRYRVALDPRPGASKDGVGTVNRTVLVRERLANDAVTIVDRLVIADNVIDLSLYDLVFDIDPAPDKTSLLGLTFIDEAVQGTSGLLGSDGTSRVEELRYMTLKVTVRSRNEDVANTFRARADLHSPIDTYEADLTQPGTARVATVGGRVTLPSLIARNL